MIAAAVLIGLVAPAPPDNAMAVFASVCVAANAERARVETALGEEWTLAYSEDQTPRPERNERTSVRAWRRADGLMVVQTRWSYPADDTAPMHYLQEDCVVSPAPDDPESLAAMLGRGWRRGADNVRFYWRTSPGDDLLSSSVALLTDPEPQIVMTTLRRQAGEP